MTASAVMDVPSQPNGKLNAKVIFYVYYKIIACVINLFLSQHCPSHVWGLQHFKCIRADPVMQTLEHVFLNLQITSFQYRRRGKNGSTKRKLCFCDHAQVCNTITSVVYLC